MFTVQGVNAEGVTFMTMQVEDFQSAMNMVEQMRQNPRCVRVDVDQRVFSEVRRDGFWKAVRK